jgi:holo-[acyl-carrier protein] synthase
MNVSQVVHIHPTPNSLGILVGVDRVDLEQFARCLRLGGGAFLKRIYTTSEVEFCAGRVDRLATRFAAKEAVAKALRRGIRGLAWEEIEVISEPNGAPTIVLHDRALTTADSLGILSISVSLTHTRTVAEAFVVALTDSK